MALRRRSDGGYTAVAPVHLHRSFIGAMKQRIGGGLHSLQALHLLEGPIIPNSISAKGVVQGDCFNLIADFIWKIFIGYPQTKKQGLTRLKIYGVTGKWLKTLIKNGNLNALTTGGIEKLERWTTRFSQWLSTKCKKTGRHQLQRCFAAFKVHPKSSNADTRCQLVATLRGIEFHVGSPRQPSLQGCETKEWPLS